MNVPEERRRLTATFLSNLGLAMIVTGFIGPAAAVSLRLATSPSVDVLTIGVSLVWLSSGVALHWLARRYLKDDGL